MGSDGQVWWFVNANAQLTFRRTQDFAWVCECVDPFPDGIGECQGCYRPVYGDDGRRVTSNGRG